MTQYTRDHVIHPVNRLSTPELQARYQWRYSTCDGVSGNFRPRPSS